MAFYDRMQQLGPEREMSLLGHLDELRSRLIICVVCLFVMTALSLLIADPVLQFLIKPVKDYVPEAPKKNDLTQGTLRLEFARDGSVRAPDVAGLLALHKDAPIRLEAVIHGDGGTSRTVQLSGGAGSSPQLNYTDLLEPIMVKIKIALVLGILLSLPVFIWQIWGFISPGLTDDERKIIRPLLGFGIFLFPLGALFAYGMLFMLIRVMQTYVVPGIATLFHVGAYVKLMTTLMIVFGSIFELPLVIALLARVGIVTPAFLSHWRRHIYVGLAVLAMVITPGTDPFSMLIALGPLILLFELSVIIARPMALMRGVGVADGDDDQYSQ